MFTDDLKYVHFKPFECFHSSLVLIVISEKPESRCLSPVFFFFFGNTHAWLLVSFTDRKGF